MMIQMNVKSWVQRLGGAKLLIRMVMSQKKRSSTVMRTSQHLCEPCGHNVQLPSDRCVQFGRCLGNDSDIGYKSGPGGFHIGRIRHFGSSLVVIANADDSYKVFFMP
mmetsp:Transcript_11369/g.13478  ORF Transcript_11369/g.13478 Transcript_11369/m.13478 type:complete len:107 (-) Transcript_11369:7-327(-)